MIFNKVISSVINGERPINNVLFAGDHHTPNPYSYQVNFPRLELVLSGTYTNEMESHNHNISNIVAIEGDVIYVPPNCWNLCDYRGSVTE